MFLSDLYTPAQGEPSRVPDETIEIMSLKGYAAFLLPSVPAPKILVFVLARPLMLIFIPAHETEIISIGVEYLRIEGAFYCGIGWLFLLYGFYRAVRKPGMSVVLTVISLGVRVALAYTLAAIPGIGVWGIWWSIPIGWFLADIFGWCYYRMKQRKSLEW